MQNPRRTGLAGGIILILLGGWLLAMQLFPSLATWVKIEFAWPLFVIAAALVILIIGLLTSTPGMAVPACVVGGIGCLLYYQNLSGNWASWAYAWTLIPGFAGVGALLAGLLGETPSRSYRDGLNLIVISAIMFLIFSSFLGGLNLLGQWWPLLLILLGTWLLIRPFFRKA